MTVKHIANMDDYKSLMEISKTKLVVIDFSAEWCVLKLLCRILIDLLLGHFVGRAQCLHFF